jgi:imidazolonepropionase
MQNNYTLLGTIKQLVTLEKLPLRGAIADDALIIIADAGILLGTDGKIMAVGKFQDLLHRSEHLNPRIVRLERDYVVTPSFVDAHTHICFAGSRANDYALRNAGKSYLDIAQSGGGIWDTVTKTRAASEAGLVAGILQRAERHLKSGITTIEVKSGYGLSVAEELKMLRAIQTANAQTQADLIPTCLAAHICPKDFDGSTTQYLDYLADELFPILKAENLTQRIDAFVEQGAFSETVIAPYFKKAKAMGFDLTVHADQFSTGGSAVAVHFDAKSADHLEASDAAAIEILAKSDTVAMALPGASLGLGCAFAPARKLLDAGAIFAVASDWNPGSAPMGDLICQAAILGTFEKLTNAELFAAITFRAAAALGLPNIGRIATGFQANLNFFETDNYQEIFYQQGKMTPTMVWKNGQAIKLD